uniref:Uncharacterized protein n=1 Tax=Ovis aries TaxID=9940 RepID=A0AC11BL96_SHEEP
MRYLLVFLLLSYWSAPQWTLPDDHCQRGTTREVIQSRVSGTVVTRKLWQPRRVAVRFASRMKGRKKTLWQRRYRGSVKARNMTTRVRRPLKGTLRKKIRSYATPSKKVKKTRKPNCFLHSCARKKLNQSRKRYKNTSQNQRRRQNQKRR